MLRLILRRRWLDPEQTVGELYFENVRFCYVLEPGWADTEYPNVDPGFYHCVRTTSNKFGETWTLEGLDTTRFPTPGIRRSAILIHPGNVDEETRGCLLPGLRRGTIAGEPAVLESAKAFGQLEQLTGKQDFYLTVI
jgi:hypothetical protein